MVVSWLDPRIIIAMKVAWSLLTKSPDLNDALTAERERKVISCPRPVRVWAGDFEQNRAISFHCAFL